MIEKRYKDPKIAGRMYIFIMSDQQIEEKIIEELEEEGELKKDSQKGAKKFEDERPRQGI
jgi:hypothetical protein